MPQNKTKPKNDFQADDFQPIIPDPATGRFDKSPPPESAASRYGSGLEDAVEGAISAPFKYAYSMGEHAIKHPWETVATMGMNLPIRAGYIDPALAARARLKDAVEHPAPTSEQAQHPDSFKSTTARGLASVIPWIPFMGPAAESIAHRMVIGKGTLEKPQPDFAGGMGELTVPLLAPAVSEYAGPFVGRQLQRGGGGVMNNALGVFGRDMRYGANPGEAVLQSGIRPGTQRGMLRRIGEATEPLSNEVTQMAASSDKRFPVSQPRGLLAPPHEEIPLGPAPTPGDMPGGLFSAKSRTVPGRPIAQSPESAPEAISAGIARNNRKSAVGSQSAAVPDEVFGPHNPHVDELGPQAATVPRRMFSPDNEGPRAHFLTSHDSGELPPVPEISGPGTLLRPPQFEPFTGQAPRYSGGINLRPAVVSPFDEEIARATHPVTGVGEPGFVKRLQETRGQLTDRPLEHMMPSEALQFRRNLGNRINFKTDPTGENVTPTLRSAYGGVTRAFHDAVPEAAPVDRQLQGLLGAREALGKTINRGRVGSDPFSVGNVPGEIIGGAAGGAPGALFGIAGNAAARSMPVRSTLASGLYHGGKAISATAPYAGFSSYLRPDLRPDEEKKKKDFDTSDFQPDQN